MAYMIFSLEYQHWIFPLRQFIEFTHIRVRILRKTQKKVNLHGLN